MTPEETARIAVEAALDKKAGDLRLLRVTELTTLADYYVICTGTSNTQMRAIADSVDKALSEKGLPPLHEEGHGSSSWVLLDFGTVIVHIFNREVREFYSLERLWSDAEAVDPASL
ncbi:MAG: ribosome silencing factor [Oscillospiraceae bacterium]|jgi:ribosome-associated protein|nr:ribosome silencing factor [Oscillospiraceae bacterium]